jgi:DNA-binding NarL/FixJ family response regulator
MDILLASARSDLRFALEVLLREQPGLAVTGTATGSEGLLALARSSCPDLVIVDWDLPGRPPADVLAVVRALDCRPYLIILGRNARDRKPALAAGADGFVLRGDPPDRLLAAVQQARVRRIAEAIPIPTNMEGE